MSKFLLNLHVDSWDVRYELFALIDNWFQYYSGNAEVLGVHISANCRTCNNIKHYDYGKIETSY